jgi:hypothetical protein
MVVLLMMPVFRDKTMLLGEEIADIFSEHSALIFLVKQLKDCSTL